MQPWMDELVESFEEPVNRDQFFHSMQQLDQKLYDSYSPPTTLSYLLQSEVGNGKPIPLGIPKTNSLTDSLLRCTLGCEEKLAKSYMEILDQTDFKQEEAKKKRVAEAKEKFAKANSHRDFCANSKPFVSNVRFMNQRPVVDNEHQAYLKTQLIYLEQPRGATCNTKSYFDKHSDIIAKKITELGGMEDTLSRMEDSLTRNEIRNFKRKDILRSDSRRSLHSPMKECKTEFQKQSWVQRSKGIRLGLESKLNMK